MYQQANDPKTPNVTLTSYTCPNCGGYEIAYDEKIDAIVCAHCRTTVEVEEREVVEYDFGRYREMESRSVPFDGMSEADCGKCGSKIAFSGSATAAVCPMCGFGLVLKDRQQSGIPPEAILPFRLDRNAARLRYKQWIEKQWFAPNDFKAMAQEGKLQAMYVPYWSYDYQAHAKYHGKGGRISGSSNSKSSMVRWTNVSGKLDCGYDDELVCASDSDMKGIFDNLTPFSTRSGAKPYDSKYLSGYSAELYSIKADTAFDEVQERTEKHFTMMAESEILSHYDRAQVTHVEVNYSDIKFKHVLLPVWYSGMYYKNKIYSYAINGDTGKVHSKRPYSIPKIAAASAAALAFVITVVALVEILF